jgi:hypothetical protein
MPHRLKILVVDDNPSDFNLIRRKILKGFGDSYHLEISHAVDSEEAMEFLKSKSYRCIILDYLLGAEDGLEVLGHIFEEVTSIPVIMMTGQGDEGIAVAAMKMGAADYLVKEDASADFLSLSIRKAIEKAELQSRLRDKQRELEHFAYTAAHDIKSPLAVINQTSQLLGMRAETLGDPEIIEHAKTIEEFTKNITDFVTELLDYAKMGRSNRPMEDVDLTSVVADVQKNLAAIIDQKQASIEVAEPLPTVKGDRVAIYQLLQNLLSNALKFCPDERTPKISVFAQGLGAGEGDFDHKICIRDNGVGIKAESLQAVFSPLVRLQETAGTEGSGLGLAISQKIIAQHNGRMWMDSEYGQGSMVSILLKCDPEISSQ